MEDPRFTHTHRATRRHVAVHGISARVRQRRVVQSVARGEGARDAVSTTALHQTASSRERVGGGVFGSVGGITLQQQPLPVSELLLMLLVQWT